MAMSMRKAFNRRMLSPMVRIRITSGHYDDNNDYIEGTESRYKFHGVIVAGNKFSQFEEGISRKSTSGGERFPDYRTLYVSRKFGDFKMSDEILFKSTRYNVLQKSDESVYDFSSYIIEKIKTSEEEHL